jgi:hypothetical protein
MTQASENSDTGRKAPDEQTPTEFARLVWREMHGGEMPSHYLFVWEYLEKRAKASEGKGSAGGRQP